ncbi:hypothetical protein GQ54DRAFT_297867 [Martensiomyces pterosporus]|nr:hypothetical protein GQ54DRAFT_297867 [Martensiomyces pterosporus]
MYRLILLLIQVLSVALAMPAPTARPDAPATTMIEPASETMNDIMGSGVKPVPTSSSKCTVGCGVGIGVGCLAGIILGAIVFITLRRHKRKLRTIWLHKRWLSRQKDLPDKPVPAPPLPLKG